MQDRYTALEIWLGKRFPHTQYSLTRLAGDASFRRYFRLQVSGQTFVVMDAPPEKENNHSFVAVAQAFAKQGIEVPTVFAVDFDLGFMLLSDLGDRLYLSELASGDTDDLYSQALAIIPKIQACRDIPSVSLQHFGGEVIHRELGLFPEWFLGKHLNIELDVAMQADLSDIFAKLVEVANEQPQVCVHRDYHSRNLLRLSNEGVGVLDFQDAVWGPITYDAVSLLRDCYIAWPATHVQKWALKLHDSFADERVLAGCSNDQFLYWFDMVGVQRHLKVLGIFSRLYYRDGKSIYLGDIPRILRYLLDVSENHVELTSLRHFLQRHVVEQYAAV